MATPLEDSILEERSVIRFLVTEGVKPSEMLSRILIQLEKSSMNRANVSKGVDRFEND